MSIRFAIKNTATKAVKEGDSTVRFSGTGEPFFRVCERSSTAIEVDAKGDPTKWSFVTGLEEDQVQFYKWYNKEEQKALIKMISDLRPVIESYFGGASMVDKNNFFFWKKNRDVSRISLTHDSVDKYYDTENPVHALLYLSIASGAFSDAVAPTKEWAEKTQTPHYMALELESDDLSEEEDITRSDAHAALMNIRKEYGKDALYILSWCVLYDTTGFGAFRYSSPEKDILNHLIKFIDGKLQTKKKKNCPKVFLDYAEKWRGQQTKPLLYTEAYVKSGEYFNFVNQREKKYVTSDGTILGNTIDEAVANLMKPKFNIDFEKLRSQVEGKWKE